MRGKEKERRGEKRRGKEMRMVKDWTGEARREEKR